MTSILRRHSNFDEIFGDSRAFDCTIANEDYFIFFTREPEPDWMQDKEGYSYNDGDVDKRLIAYDRTQSTAEAQLNLLSGNVKGFSFPECAMTYTPLEQVIVYDGGEGSFSIGSGQRALEITELLRGSRKSRTIGDKIYVAQARRRVKYRTGESHWQLLGDDIGLPSDITAQTRIASGFMDVDGFDENHIYAVGGEGDVWRCIDNQWIQCGFPTNLDLDVVCCAGDGKVYIAGTQGLAYVGKEDNWQQVKGALSSLPFKDMVWHEDKIWCSNDYGLWWITDGKVELAKVPIEVRGCSGSLSSQFGKLLVAGYGGAALHENGEWTLLF